MKTKSLILAAFVVVLFEVLAQNPLKPELVPAPVKTALKQKYPSHKSVAWFVNGSNYVATFKNEGKVTDVLFDSTGNFVQSETHFKKNNLSPIVLAGIQNSMSPEWKLNDAEFIETKDHVYYYIIELKKGNELSKIKMDIEGNVVSN